MKVIFRCDGWGIGLGHVSRSLALAEALEETGAEVVLAGRYGNAAQAIITSSGVPVLNLAEMVNVGNDLDRVIDLARDQMAGMLILDSYRVDEAYLTTISHAGLAVVLIDDFMALSHYDCTALINFTVGAPRLAYPKNGPLYLLGPGYFLARRRMRQARPQSQTQKRSAPIRHLLVAVAGEDPLNLTGKILELLSRQSRDLCVRAIVDATCAHQEQLRDQVAGFAPGSECVTGLSDLADMMVWADACISGGGLIKYEAAFMGVPVAVISQNPAQALETKSFVRAGLAHDLAMAGMREDEDLAHDITSFITDTELQTCIAHRAGQVFTEDPTSRAAKAVLEEIRKR